MKKNNFLLFLAIAGLVFGPLAGAQAAQKSDQPSDQSAGQPEAQPQDAVGTSVPGQEAVAENQSIYPQSSQSQPQSLLEEQQPSASFSQSGSQSIVKPPQEEEKQGPIEGQVYKGKVVHVLKAGLFVKFGFKDDGIVHFSEIDLAPGQELQDVIHLGEKVEVKFLGFDARGRSKLRLNKLDGSDGFPIISDNESHDVSMISLDFSIISDNESHDVSIIDDEVQNLNALDKEIQYTNTTNQYSSTADIDLESQHN
jgi:predicted RNA-binding protein with RPS1 domain